MPRRHLFLSACSLVSMALTSGCANKYSQFGEPLTMSASDTIAVEKVLAAPQDYDGKTVRLTGMVSNPRAHIGSAPPMTGGQDPLRVTSVCPSEGRIIPMEAKGRKAIVEGKFALVEISEEMARHYQEESGASPEEIEAIKGPQKTLAMNSNGALVDLD
ncbi:MAG: hypothetical protein GY778_24320 [bacterium]|nr:hypothetical protein [bacterium]